MLLLIASVSTSLLSSQPLSLQYMDEYSDVMPVADQEHAGQLFSQGAWLFLSGARRRGTHRTGPASSRRPAFLSMSDVAADLCLEQANQRRIHEVVIVGDIEADHPLAAEIFLEPAAQLVEMAFSITKITSAQSIISPSSGISASLFVPADMASMPGYCEKTCSAVGLRSRFWLQMKRRFRGFGMMYPVDVTQRGNAANAQDILGGTQRSDVRNL